MESLERFGRFRRIVLDEPELQERLRSIVDWPQFFEAAVNAASERGIDLSEADVLVAREEAKRSWLERWV